MVDVDERDVLEVLKQMLRELKPRGCRVSVKMLDVHRRLGLPKGPWYYHAVRKALLRIGAKEWPLAKGRCRVYLLEGEVLERLLEELEEEGAYPR